MNISQVLNLKFAKINKRGGPYKVRGWEKFPKINKRPPPFIKHQRVRVRVAVILEVWFGHVILKRVGSFCYSKR